MGGTSEFEVSGWNMDDFGLGGRLGFDLADILVDDGADGFGEPYGGSKHSINSLFVILQYPHMDSSEFFRRVT